MPHIHDRKPQNNRHTRATVQRLPQAEDALVKQQSPTPTDTLSAQAVQNIQRTYGNQATLRMLGRAPSNQIQRGVLTSFAKSNVFGGEGERQTVRDDFNSNRFNGDPQPVTIDSTDNVKLTGVFYTASDYYKQNGNAADKTVLFLSGSGGSAETYSFEIAKSYAERGANTLAVNYRGFGGSKQEVTQKDGNTKLKNITPTQQGIYEDARSMFNWLIGQGIAPGSVLVHGYSLGGAISTELVAQLAEEGINIAGLVMHSPMESTRAAAKDSAEDMTGFSVKGTKLRILPKKWARKIGAKIAEAAESPLTTQDKLTRLAQIRPDFPIFMMSGEHGSGDHLDINHTGMSNNATNAGLTNVTTSTSTGTDHFNTKQHMNDTFGDLSNWLTSLNDDETEQVDDVLDDMGITEQEVVTDTN